MKISEIKKELETQDNLATAHPIFCVYDWEKIPTDSDYSDNYFWCQDEGEYTDDEVKQILRDNNIEFTDDNWEDKAKEDSWNKVYYLEKKVFINCFFTRKAAQRFIDQNHYHYSEKVHIYVNCLWRNPEMQGIREGIMKGNIIEKEGKTTDK